LVAAALFVAALFVVGGLNMNGGTSGHMQKQS
jgi:hypothetical protein